MNIKDLQHIFKQQLESITSSQGMLYYMLIDDNHTIIDRHPSNDLENLLTTLDNFHYDSSKNGIPRFVK